MPHDTVSAGRPVVRSGRCHPSVGPAVLIDDVDDPALVGEAAVLHASAVEIFIRALRQGEDGAGLAAAGLEEHRRTLAQDVPATAQIRHGHRTVILGKSHLHDISPQFPGRIRLRNGITHGTARIPDQNVGGRISLGITDDAAVVIPEETENIRSIEIHCHPVAAVEKQLDRRRVEPPGTVHRILNRFCRCSRRKRCGDAGDCHCGKYQEHYFFHTGTFLKYLQI